MIKVLRAQSPVLLAILLVLICLSFIVFYNIPSLQHLREGNLGRIDGRSVTSDEFRLAQQAAAFSVLLTTGQDLGGRDSGTEMNRLAWQRLLLLTSARQLGLTVTDAQVVLAIRNLSFLQHEGKFDSAMYDRFTGSYLASRGLNSDRFEQIMREEILINKVYEAVLAPVQVPAAEVDETLQSYFGPIKVNIVRLRQADFLSQAGFDPAAVEKAYRDNPANPAFRTAEKRRVEIVFFPLTPEQQKLAPEKKAEVKRALGEKATELAVALLDKNASDPAAFASLAQQRGLSLATTGLFAQNEAPPQFPPSPALNHAAFQLTFDVPVSDAVETENAYAVLRLLEVKPSELRPLAEVRDVIEKRLRGNAAQELTRQRGADLVQQIKGPLSAGKTWATVTKELKLTVENPPAFVPIQAPPALNDADAVVEAARTMVPGQLSKFISTPDGGLIFFLESRAAADKATAEKLRPRMETQLLSERRQQLLEEWLRLRTQRTGMTLPDFLSNAKASGTES